MRRERIVLALGEAVLGLVLESAFCAAGSAEQPAATDGPRGTGPIAIEHTIAQLQSSDWTVKSGAIARTGEIGAMRADFGGPVCTLWQC